MADTSTLNIVTEYIMEKLGEQFGTKLYKQKLRIGSSNLLKEFTGVSKDKSIVVYVCHHGGRTSGGNIPSAKLDGIFSKCYFMEKIQARQKYIFFTNYEFYDMFRCKSEGILEGIELKYFEELTESYKALLDEVIKKASVEMS